VCARSSPRIRCASQCNQSLRLLPGLIVARTARGCFGNIALQ